MDCFAPYGARNDGAYADFVTRSDFGFYVTTGPQFVNFHLFCYLIRIPIRSNSYIRIIRIFV